MIVENFACDREDTESFWVITEKICYKIIKNLQLRRELPPLEPLNVFLKGTASVSGVDG